MDTTSLSIYQYNNAPVSFRKADGSLMVNATEMAKAFGKLPADWLRLTSTTEYLQECSSDMGIPISALVQVVKGGNWRHQGTWVQEDVALELARWLSPKFALWCNKRIKELLSVGITATPATLEQLADNPDMLIELATRLKQLRQQNHAQQEHIAALQRQNEAKEAAIVELKKRSDYVEVILASKELVTITQIAADYGMSAKAFNKKLAELKIQRKVNGQWILYSPYSAQGYTHSRTIQITHRNGSLGTAMHTEWRQKGRLFLYETLKAHNILPMIER